MVVIPPWFEMQGAAVVCGQRAAALARSLTRLGVVERSALCSEVAIRRRSFAPVTPAPTATRVTKAGLVYGKSRPVHPGYQRARAGIAQAGLAHAGYGVAPLSVSRAYALQHQACGLSGCSRRRRAPAGLTAGRCGAPFLSLKSASSALFFACARRSNSIAFHAACAAQAGQLQLLAPARPEGGPAAAAAWSRRWWRRSIWRCTAARQPVGQQIEGPSHTSRGWATSSAAAVGWARAGRRKSRQW